MKLFVGLNVSLEKTARRNFSREFKIEAVRLVTERGVAVPQAARDLDIAQSVLRRWIRELRQPARLICQASARLCPSGQPDPDPSACPQGLTSYCGHVSIRT